MSQYPLTKIVKLLRTEITLRVVHIPSADHKLRPTVMVHRMVDGWEIRQDLFVLGATVPGRLIVVPTHQCPVERFARVEIHPARSNYRCMYLRPVLGT